MKKSVIVSLVVFVILLSISTTALAQSEKRIIYPWHYGDEIEVYTSDYIVLGARWGACTKGLANVGTRQTTVIYSLDGTSLVSSQKESRRYWNEPILEDVYNFEHQCVQGPTFLLWWAFWEYELGLMRAGDYEVYFEYLLDRTMVDGVDNDGDGEPDHYPPLLIVKDFTIHVVDG